MALVPFNDKYVDKYDNWLNFDHPFGYDAVDAKNNYYWPARYRPYAVARHLDEVHKEWEGKIGRDGFEVSIDVNVFAPHEITVKTVDNTITIEGKHEDKFRNGFLSRSRRVARSYTLPPEYDARRVTSSLSSNGILTLKAPRSWYPRIFSRNEKAVDIKRSYI